MTTEDALLAAVLAAPDDDVVRKAYADWCRENGQEERADFIEVQLADVDRGRQAKLLDENAYLWFPPPLVACLSNTGTLFKTATTGMIAAHIIRGFVSEVRCTLAEWCGGECHNCLGEGWADTRRGGRPDNLNCPVCNGTGRTVGIGPQIVRRHPVTKLVLTDRRPDRSSWSTPSSSGEVFDWYRAGSALDTSDPSVLPNDFFLSCEMLLERTHKTEEDAFAALSIAAIDWAKSQPTHAVYHGDGQAYRIVPTGA